MTLPSSAVAGTRALGISDASELQALDRETADVPAPRATFAAFRDAAAHADTVHIAGHTERQPGLGESALVFADRSARAHGRPPCLANSSHRPTICE